MGWNHLIDFTGRDTSRISSPEMWQDMFQKRYISDVLKNELIQEKNLSGKTDHLEWYLLMEDGYCYAICFCDGLEYRNGGTGWSFSGGADIAKKIFGDTLVKVT